MIDSFQKLFDQYIDQLYREIELFPENQLWLLSGSIANSAGTLGLHLCGNLRFFIGNAIGQNGYVRNREEEFSAQIPKVELLKLIMETRKIVFGVFNELKPEDLLTVKKFELRSLNHPVTTGYFLTHLAAHLGYHVGQLNYFRRIIS